ncbi:tyrosine-type recombinase/integrase [Flavobacterium sp.]|uniref:tyrosine-type recombinase/integrase n=1 Tax=Flavobacterium sp. TaxID=239 RepID=UPI0039E28ED2
MKLNFSEPKIFTGGIAMANWAKLSKEAQNEALKKDWYIYYSFRDPKTGKLVRQPNIKAGANKFKNCKDRIAVLKTLQRNLLMLLQKGFSPYADNTALEVQLFQKETAAIEPLQCNVATTVATAFAKPDMTFAKPENQDILIGEAFALALKVKANVLSKTSFPGFSSNVKRFEIWLNENGFAQCAIATVTKKEVIDYLNVVLERTSPRTRNNTRIDISTLFQTLVDNEIIKENFVATVNVLKATPERNKTYTATLQRDIYDYMEQNDKILLLFVKFISYNFLRPIEVCRLKVDDIDVIDRKLYVKAKNSPVKTKIIPEILINDLPDLSKLNKTDFLFTPTEIGGEWNTAENDKRDYFSKRFKKVKDHFGLGKDYGLYSFRHTFITRLYQEFAKVMTPYEAKSKLMLITGHTTMDALEKYLRDIDAVLPEDYSGFL